MPFILLLCSAQTLVDLTSVHDFVIKNDRDSLLCAYVYILCMDSLCPSMGMSCV